MDTMSIHVQTIEGGGSSNIHIGNHIHQTENRCLADLRTTDPRDDKRRIQRTKGGLLKDSYNWILDHADFRRWYGDDQCRLLWINGDPGKGKTMLLCGIINHLESTAAGCHLSYFFCQGTDSRINNATAVLRGLIYLLVRQQPSLISHVRKKYDHAGKQLFDDPNAFDAVSEIFGAILCDPSLGRAYLIVDALDECEVGLPQLLDLLLQVASLSSQVKWVVSSRNIPKIKERLELAGQKVGLSLELNPESISAAVNIYIDHKLSQLKSLRNDKTLQDQIRSQVRKKANGTFLWVAFVFQELEQEQSWDVLNILQEMPTDLASLYCRMLAQIQQLGRKNPELCRLVIATATLAYRPLHLLELGALSSLPEEISSKIQSLRKIVEMCGSFLTIRDDYVYIIHQSVKDYLTKNEEASAIIFPTGPAEVHHSIFSRSLQAMSILRRDIYDLRNPGFQIEQVTSVNPDPLARIRYACVYWVDHLCKIDRSLHNQAGLCDNGTIYLFLRSHFLYWLEALSLIRSMPSVVVMIRKLENMLAVSILSDYNTKSYFELSGKGKSK